MARTVHDKMSEIPSLKDYGAACDGVTDDLSAFQAMRSIYPSGMFITPGKTKINNRILPAGLNTINQADFAIIGDSDMVENPEFNNSALGWTLESGWVAGSNKITHLTAGLSRAYTTVHIKPRTLYQLSIDIITTASGVVNFKVAGRDLFPGETIYQEAGVSVPGMWFSPVTNPKGEDSHIFGVSTTTWEFTWLTGNEPEGDYHLEITTADIGLWRGEVSKVSFIEVQQELNFSSATAISHNDATFLDSHGFKIANGNYNVTGLGDRQTLALLNGKDVSQTNSPGAHNVAIGARALANSIIGDENTAVGAMAAQYTEGTSNSWFGYSAGKFAVKSIDCVGLGYKALYVGSNVSNTTSIGYQASFFLRTASNSTAVGFKANHRNVEGNNGTFLGARAGFNDGGSDCTGIGYQSGSYVGGGAALSYINNTAVGSRSQVYGSGNTAAGSQSRIGSYNTSTGSLSAFNNGTSIGFQASVDGTSGLAVGYDSRVLAQYGIAIGPSARANSSSQVSIGLESGTNSNGSNNVAVGNGAGKYVSANAYENTTCLGAGAIVSGSNQVQLGNSSTTTYVYGTVQNRSDSRDKVDVRDTGLGIEFIIGLRPVDGKWDLRDDYYEEITETYVDPITQAIGSRIIKKPVAKDGSKKRNRYHHWFIAQEVNELCNQLGVEFGGIQHQEINGGDDVWTLGYDEFIPPIVKSIQECWSRMDELEERIRNLE